MDWLRLYVDVKDDPKVQKLKPEIFKTWINLLCLSRKYDGALPGDEDLAWELRMPVKSFQAAMKILTSEPHELFHRSKNGYEPHNWNARQPVSDSSTERVRKFREKRNGNRHGNGHSDVSGNGHETVSKRAREEKRRTEQSRAEKSRAEPVSPTPPESIQNRYHEFVANWPHPTDVDLGAQYWLDLVESGEITNETVGSVFDGLERWKRSRQWGKGFKPGVAKWLAQKRWRDDPEQISEEAW